MHRRRLQLLGAAGLAALLLALGLNRGMSAPPKTSYTTWSDYGGGSDGSQYSALKQISKNNVSQLELAWSYPVPGPSGRFGFNPIVVDNVMYVLIKDGYAAIDATTGKTIWTHPTDGSPTDRGINYWQNKDGSDRRLIFAANSYLQEINARTGVTIPSFGDDGRVDLRDGLGRDPKTIPNIQTGTPGHVFENLIILGSATSEAWGSPPGDLRAYDILTGKMAWIFHTVPHPGEFGYDTWPKDAWKYVGGTNTWGEIAIDEKRGIGYFPLGSPTYDLYGADRIGAGLFGDCLLALDLRTGKRLWHFQAVHHDLWDYDFTTGPKLMTVRHNGKMVDIVAQAGKTGFLYVFDRVTGEPLWPIEERPVPKSTMPGEESWPTQPFPTKPPPFARQHMTVDDIDPYLDPQERERYRQVVLNSRNDGIFTPPGLTPSIELPGEFGGSNWGGGAADLETGMLYIKTNNIPTTKILAPRPPIRPITGATAEVRGRAIFNQFCQGCHGPDRSGVMSPKDIGIDRFKRIVSGGEGEMPGFPDFTAAYLDDVAAYIVNPEAAGPGNSASGAALSGGGGGDRLPPPPGQKRYYGTLGNVWLASNGLPVISPPWSTLTAYDLNEGTIKWQVPVGTAPGLAAKGIRNTGSFYHRNGPVVTAGGLIFIGTFVDRTVRAFDKDTGKVVWERQLDANPEGFPAVYEVAGREYVVFCARTGPLGSNVGEHADVWSPGKPEAQGYYAFALPKAARK